MPDPVVGILLAAGNGRRFDPDGKRNKLMQTLPGGDPVAVASAKNLLAALPVVLAVVRPGDDSLAAALSQAGCEVTRCASAGNGMAASLVHALAIKSSAPGWVIALADMPLVLPSTIARLRAAIDGGAHIAVPTCDGRRGNPVAFSRLHLGALLSLQGDQGARRLLDLNPVEAIDVDDPGVLQDIDTHDDFVRVTS